MPTPKQLANLSPGKGRPSTDREQITIRLSRYLLDELAIAMEREQISSKSIAIERWLRIPKQDP